VIDLACPMCRTPLILVTRHATPALTVEARLYGWLFDLLLDKTATIAQKARAREIIDLLGFTKPRGRRREIERCDLTLGKLIRLVIHERAHGPEQ
jgi:uncharacterized protein YbaR (Trm112 family)